MTTNNINMKKAKYKTQLCRNFESPQGCSYNEKCQFAHGVTELNTFGNQQDFMGDSFQGGMKNFQGGFYGQQPVEQFAIKKLPNPQNYKIVKCKNFEATGNCKYREMCTFAHGESELRTKNENTFLVPNSSSQGNNFNYSQPQVFMNPNQMYGFGQGMNFPQEWSPEMSQQMFAYQNYPFQGGENMMVNPNNINLNSSSGTSQGSSQGYGVGQVQPYMGYQMQGNFGIGGQMQGQGSIPNENYMKNMQK